MAWLLRLHIPVAWAAGVLRWVLASTVEGPAWKAFAWFAMFCSMPIYPMLWAGQLHVVLVLAVTLIRSD